MPEWQIYNKEDTTLSKLLNLPVTTASVSAKGQYEKSSSQLLKVIQLEEEG